VRTIAVGANALLIEVADPSAWFVELDRRRSAGELIATDIVPAAETVLIDGVPDPGRLTAVLPGWAPPAGPAIVQGSLIEIPIEYGGADLADVAAFWGTGEREVIERLSATEFQVAFCGFAPGFGYLTGLPPELTVPRLAEPRPRVPPGSLGLAGPYAGIYPTASPGGWRLVGRTDLPLFDAAADPPALLVPGTRVRLVRV
jgi:KipI family sensor histidine kinase inhibitor